MFRTCQPRQKFPTGQAFVASRSPGRGARREAHARAGADRAGRSGHQLKRLKIAALEAIKSSELSEERKDDILTALRDHGRKWAEGFDKHH